jgi:1,4-dihydroxy-2-naphthoate octaprenyltransferase
MEGMNMTQFRNIVEIRTKVISMVTFFCGSLYAFYRTGLWSWKVGLLMGLAVLCVDMGTTGFNTYFDFVNGTDSAKTNREKDKVLVHEGVDPASALLVSVVLFLVAAALGLLLAYVTSWKLIVVGFFCMVAGFAYTGGPFPISRTPFGEVFAGGFLGSVLFMLSFYVQTKRIDVLTFVVSIPFLLLVAMILTVNNTCDFDSDRLAGRKTLSIVLGKKKSLWLPGFEYGVALVVTLVMLAKRIFPLWSLPFLLLAFCIGFLNMKTLYARGFSPETKSISMATVAKIYLLYGAGFFLGFLGSCLNV